jgi:hypothetical protein
MRWHVSLSTSANSFNSRTRNNGAHSVQPVAVSVSVKVCTKLPLAVGPLCHEISLDEPRR